MGFPTLPGNKRENTQTAFLSINVSTLESKFPAAHAPLIPL